MEATFGGLDGEFVFYAVVTPDGKIPTFGEDHKLHDSNKWYTSPIGSIAHLSEFALVFTDWNDATADFEHHKAELPEGTTIRAFTVTVEEFDPGVDPDETIEAWPVKQVTED